MHNYIYSSQNGRPQKKKPFSMWLSLSVSASCCLSLPVTWQKNYLKTQLNPASQCKAAQWNIKLISDNTVNMLPKGQPQLSEGAPRVSR